MKRRKTNGKGAQSLAQWLQAVSMVCTKKRQAKGECSRSNSPEILAARKLIRETSASSRAAFGREQQSKRRHNPDATAADLFEAFTGRESTKETLVEEKIHSPAKLADLGELIELQAILPDEKRVAVIGFEKRGVQVGAAGVKKDSRGIYGTELHFVGGDQTIDLADVDATHQKGKPTIVIGTAYKIAYRTSKHFHSFKVSVYEHEFGEENGVRPILAYDPRSRKLFLAGGNYEIRPEGITN